ncbi:MAG: acetate--CoA ligase [Bradymonadales bacterium]|nr:acetate--CoA ligase [Bradymonadales bacterium]
MGEEKTIVSMSAEKRVFNPPAELSKQAWVKSMEQYREMWRASVEDPDGFWGKVAQDYVWMKPYDKVLDYSFGDNPDDLYIKWFKGGKLNVTVQCLDRHLETRGDQPAIIWQGEPEEDARTYTYRELYQEVCRFANVLKNHGIQKGDRVAIYLPMIPELPIAMLACARIGAVHSIVFGGFSPDSLRDRIIDSSCRMLITSDGSYRSGKTISLKANADAAMTQTPSIEKCIVFKRTGNEVSMQDGRDSWAHDEMKGMADSCEPEMMDAEDPLFILYTSGSTGKPKGVLHTQAGYIIYVAHSFKYIFDYHEGDVFWCTADIGWVTGHSYIVYGPLAAGAQSVMFEGVPTYPDVDRFWQVCEKYKVNIFYTAPTAIRAVMRYGDEPVTRHDLSTLRVLGTVGEPINPEAWMWYYTVVGKERCPIVDTWWQTETGGILITPLPGAIPIKPGSATMPYFGLDPVVLREDGTEASVNEGGYLCIRKPWPGMMRTVYGQHSRFHETYFIRFPGMYYTGDGARKDEDGYFWLMGRLDDVINVSGHRMGTAEVESALVSHPAVAESAVVGFPHEIKGQGIYAYVTLKVGFEPTDELKKVLANHVRKEIGPIATPDKIQWAPALPKTRSGKIMRRILKKIAAGEASEIGDTTTLADPAVVEALIEGAK